MLGWSDRSRVPTAEAGDCKGEGLINCFGLEFL